MDDPLQKALDSLQQSINKRTKKVVQALVIEEEKEHLYKANHPQPSPRDQQDLMTLPFFSLSKTKRTEPIEYQQGDVSVVVDGLSRSGIATIWDADFLIWTAAQLNAALEAGERPSRRLWIVPYHLSTGYQENQP